MKWLLRLFKKIHVCECVKTFWFCSPPVLFTTFGSFSLKDVDEHKGTFGLNKSIPKPYLSSQKLVMYVSTLAGRLGLLESPNHHSKALGLDWWMEIVWIFFIYD